MKTTCQTCSTRYEIPDARAAGKVLKIRCKRCESVMEVIGPTSAFSSDPAYRPPTMTGMQAYRPTAVALQLEDTTDPRFWAGIGGRRHGPYRAAELHALVERGDVHGRTYLWASGMTNWERASESAVFSFVYGWIIERAGEHMAAQGPAESSAIYDMAQLVTDGNSYFPDPTLKSGWLVLDERTQAYLETCARRGTLREPDARKKSRVAAASLMAFGAIAFATGSAWLVTAATLAL